MWSALPPVGGRGTGRPRLPEPASRQSQIPSPPNHRYGPANPRLRTPRPHGAVSRSHGRGEPHMGTCRNLWQGEPVLPHRNYAGRGAPHPPRRRGGAPGAPEFRAGIGRVLLLRYPADEEFSRCGMRDGRLPGNGPCRYGGGAPRAARTLPEVFPLQGGGIARYAGSGSPGKEERLRTRDHGAGRQNPPARTGGLRPRNALGGDERGRTRGRSLLSHGPGGAPWHSPVRAVRDGDGARTTRLRGELSLPDQLRRTGRMLRSGSRCTGPRQHGSDA